MKDFNVVRLDSKGRVIIPFHVRDYVGLKEGAELIVTNNERKEIRIFPLINGTAKLEIVISDKPGSLASVLDELAAHSVDVLMSTSKTLERGKIAEWTAIADISACKDIRKMENDLRATGVVKKLRVEEK